MKLLYKIVFENEKGVIFRIGKYDVNCKNVCFVHHTSYEKYKHLYNQSNTSSNKNKIKISSLEDLYEFFCRNINKKTFRLIK